MRIKADLKPGVWARAQTSAADAATGLTALAVVRADEMIAKLKAEGIEASLHQDRVRFTSARPASRDARLIIETHGDLIEARLRTRELDWDRDKGE